MRGSAVGLCSRIRESLPTQHSIMRSRVSLAQTTSFGSNSVNKGVSIYAVVVYGRAALPVIILATVALGKERSSSFGGRPPCPSPSDILDC